MVSDSVVFVSGGHGSVLVVTVLSCFCKGAHMMSCELPYCIILSINDMI